MPIITISRGSFSGGKMLAEAVASKLGYRCIGREQLVRKAAAWGVSEEDLHTALEQPPKFFGQSAHTKYRYLALIQAALAEEVRHGDAVYHGLGGHVLLGKAPHVLRTRIIAPMHFRIAQAQQMHGFSRDEAVAYIEKVDNDRHKWTMFLYGFEWTDPSLYDLVLNLEQLNLAEACDCICCTAQMKCFTPENRQALDELALCSRVKAKLAMDNSTADCEFEVLAEDGSLTISGEIVSPDQAKRVAAVARAIPGVTSVNLKQLKMIARI